MCFLKVFFNVCIIKSLLVLFVVVLRPSNIKGHIMTGTDLSQCALMATL